MRICDINPFIRYADLSEFGSANDFVYSYDSQLFYLAEGECEIELEKEDRMIKKDTLLLWQAGTRYRFKRCDNVQMVVVNFDYTQKYNEKIAPIPLANTYEFERSDINEGEKFEDCDIFNHPLVLENMQGVKVHLIEIVEAFGEAELYKSEACSALLKSVLTKIALASLHSERQSLDVINAVLEYFMQNLDKEMTNKDIGKFIGYHPNYINRLMLKHTGITLRQHLINIRLDAARNLLMNAHIPIYEIAEKCGFKNAAYFSNRFKSKYKMSPIEYRKQYKWI